MKKPIAILFLSLAFLQLTAQTKKVLFLGNSYTYVNNLPELLKQLALSAGDSIYYDSNCLGGYTLQMHSQDATSIAKINAQPWDYVILQCQSQEPSLDTNYVQQNVFPYAHFLDSTIHANDSCTQTIFFMTWGRKNGDATNCAAYPPVCTFLGMQQQLHNRYLQMANDNNAIVAPAGDAWKNVIATNPAFDLYQTDESHPSLYGSYLAACVFYSTIYRTGSVALPYYGGLPQSEANILQNYGSSTVLDSMPLWRTESYYPVADFVWNNSSGNTIDCIASSGGITSFLWNDGIGSGFINGTANQSFTYSGPGLYSITLVVSNGCWNDTITQSVMVGPSSINESSSNELQIRSAINEPISFFNGGTAPVEVSVYSYDGRLISSFTCANGTTKTLDLNDSGIYLAVVQTEYKMYSLRFVKLKD